MDLVEAPTELDQIDPDDPPDPNAAPAMLPVVNTIGSVSVHTTDQTLLAELLAHFGRRRS